MGKTKYQMGSIFVIVLYFIAFILCIAIYFLSYIYDLPYIDTISYDNRSIIEFIKHNNTIIGDVAKPFCNFHSDETEFKTEDFALLSTLPRLYDVNTEGKCFIKPKFRGVFNSTMKYIFGEDYNSQGIRIYCWAKTYNPYLIITSQSFLESKKSVFENSTITDIYNNYSKLYETQEYFNDTDHLCDHNHAEMECSQLKDCIIQENGNYNSNNCKDEWSQFTNSYWKEFSEDYDPSINGLEQYQISLTDNFVFQPDFYYTKDSQNIYLSGTHYIVGGGIENMRGYGLLIENIIRVYLPSLIESILPFYTFFIDLFHTQFTLMSELTQTLLYIETISNKEIQNFANLVNMFNISTSCMFFIGHSISGSTIKELSYVTNISGIAFESSQSLGYAEYRLGSEFTTEQNGTKNIANLFTSSAVITGQDDSFAINGKLPSLSSSIFYIPNVYDTACSAVITCSHTERYVPYCKEVLKQSESYNKIMDAYQRMYAY